MTVMGDLCWDGRLGEGSGEGTGDLGDGGIWSNQQIGLSWDTEGQWTICGGRSGRGETGDTESLRVMSPPWDGRGVFVRDVGALGALKGTGAI